MEGFFPEAFKPRNLAPTSERARRERAAAAARGWRHLRGRGYLLR